ncbi:hypothetical protein [Pandoraea pnomenusa]|uniref:hypothetical protein n=1 Tax=Pandoraea pnomenusa TaxID=93220 RepID=UPI00333EECE6
MVKPAAASSSSPSLASPSSLKAMSLLAPLSSMSPLASAGSMPSASLGRAVSADMAPTRELVEGIDQTSLPARTDDAAITRPSLVILAPGQSFHGYVCRGTVLHVQQGHVVLNAAPRRLAAHVWRTTASLQAGEVYVIDCAGWLTLGSDAGARVILRDNTVPSGFWQRLMERLGA